VVRKTSDSPTTSIISITDVEEYNEEENEVSVIHTNKKGKGKEVDEESDWDSDDDEEDYDEDNNSVKKEVKPTTIKNSLFEKVDTLSSKNSKKKSDEDDDDDQESSNWDSDESDDKPKPKVRIITNNLFSKDNESKKSKNEETV